MTDFRKVTGAGGVETNLNFLRSEVVRLSNENQALNNELLNRSGPRLPEMCDALSQLALLAGQGHPAAKAALANFFQVLDRAREAASAITVVRNGSS